jgi:hypothetical protein
MHRQPVSKPNINRPVKPKVNRPLNPNGKGFMKQRSCYGRFVAKTLEATDRIANFVEVGICSSRHSQLEQPYSNNGDPAGGQAAPVAQMDRAAVS